MIKKFIAGLLAGLTGLAVAATISVWQPGGDLSTATTWNNQIIANLAVTGAKIADATIDLTTKVFGTLPVGNGGTGVTALGDITKTDDTNVTVTLGGTPTNSTIQDVSFTLGWTGQLAATRGGTGTGTVATGDLLYGSAVNTWSKLTASADGEFLTLTGGVPTWGVPAGGVTGLANPTGTIGLSAVNGSATTAMRSDAAPPLSQAIAPNWSASHDFQLAAVSGGPWPVEITSANPGILWNETDATANNRVWEFRPSGEQFAANLVNDGLTSFTPWLTVDRTANVADAITLSAATGVDVNSTASRVINLNSTDANGPFVRWQRSGTSFADMGTEFQVIGSGTNNSLFLGTRSAQGSVGLISGGTKRLEISNSGAWTVNNGSTTGAINWGTYTPSTPGGNTNITGVTFSSGTPYLRVGNAVTMSFQVVFTVTSASTGSVLFVALPIASNFVQVEDASGSCANTGTSSAIIIGEPTNNVLQMAWESVGTGVQRFGCAITYQVL